ncbi:MAG: hypothetical protein JNK73_05945 [Bacteroidia bacterium]|nr:hypothetical protein [Bacteroidia bacterium]
MSDLSYTREEILELCFSVLAEKRNEMERDLSDINDSVNTETKSSAGDKHETARARMQAEQSRLLKQLLEIKAQELDLERIGQLKKETKISLGSIVYTTSGVFFVAIALGKLRFGQTDVHVVSAQSPLAAKMMGRATGETFELNGNSYFIENIL